MQQRKTMKDLYCVLIAVLFAGIASTQISIQSQDLMKILGPGPTGGFYYAPGVSGGIDLGNTGGQNVYDFSDIGVSVLNFRQTFHASETPALAPRFPAGCWTFGSHPDSLEKNPAFVLSHDTSHNYGDITLMPNSEVHAWVGAHLLMLERPMG
jgi:hypothetical protein